MLHIFFPLPGQERRKVSYIFYFSAWGGEGRREREEGGKEKNKHAGDLGLIPGSGRFPGEGNNNPLQYSCLENPMDGGA